ncbi:hypothetical protein DICPUDRAFT_75881 [Dictyostelium purpureum]|uniref:Uncharacterized protein n=1 Tax=Dictyostelium purpureum TaxID=5786 RepID=F0ZBY2_DICPU|nr:uncharacterized protein DICPUDRAFT_75881 [Dictyostelium purpureum]EGC38541.1 hypothetical protein DICPUDRAFT_75881 [Dictyostelium purpureum]|eukprot:XP_003284912.1 hypothetical protein DICPUDRAFT_75881 [Dictyostelium purpureum]
MYQFSKINRVIPKNSFVKAPPLHPTSLADKLIIKPPNQQQQQQNINSVDEINDKFKHLKKPNFPNLKSNNNNNQSNNTNNNNSNTNNSNSSLFEFESSFSSTLSNYPIKNVQILREESKLIILKNKSLLSEGKINIVINNFQKLIQQQQSQPTATTTEEQQKVIDELFSLILLNTLSSNQTKELNITIEFFKNYICQSNFNNYLSSYNFIQFIRELYKKSINDITIVNKVYKILFDSKLVDIRINFIFATFYLETKNELLSINLFKNNFKKLNNSNNNNTNNNNNNNNNYQNIDNNKNINNNNNNINNSINNNCDIIKINNIKNNIYKIENLNLIWDFNSNNQILFLNEPIIQFNFKSKEYLEQLDWVNKLFSVSSKGNHFKFYQLIYELFIPNGIINSTSVVPSFTNHLYQCLINGEFKLFKKMIDIYKKKTTDVDLSSNTDTISKEDTLKAQIVGLIYFYCYFNQRMNELKDQIYYSFISDSENDVKYFCENNYTRFKEVLFNTFITCSLEIGKYGEALRFSDIKKSIIMNEDENQKHYTVGFRDDFYSPFINFHAFKKDKTSEHFWISKGKSSIKINLPTQRCTYRYNSSQLIEETDRLSNHKTYISQKSNYQNYYSQLKSIYENNTILKKETKFGTIIEEDNNFVKTFTSYLFMIDKEIINNLKFLHNINETEQPIEQPNYQYSNAQINNNDNNNNNYNQLSEINNNNMNKNFNNNKYFDINNYNNNKNNFIINLIYNNNNNNIYNNLNYDIKTNSVLNPDNNNYFYYDLPHSNLFIKSIQRLKNHFNKKEKKSDYLLFISKLSKPLQDLINSGLNEWFDFLYIQKSDLKLMKKLLPQNVYLSNDFYNFWLQTISSYNDFNTLTPCMELLEFMLKTNIPIYQRSIKSFSFLLFQNTQPLTEKHLKLIYEISSPSNNNLIGDALDDLKLKLKFYPTNCFDEFNLYLQDKEVFNVLNSILNSKYLSRNLIELYVNLASRAYPIKENIKNFCKWELVFIKFSTHETSKEELLVNQKAYVFSVCSSLIRSSMTKFLKEFIYRYSNVFGLLHQKKIIDITSHLEISDQAYLIQNLVKPQNKYYTYFVDFIKKLKSKIDNPLNFPIFDQIISKEIPYTNNDLNNFVKNFSIIYYPK